MRNEKIIRVLREISFDEERLESETLGIGGSHG